jgi:hypothetical protein
VNNDASQKKKKNGFIVFLWNLAIVCYVIVKRANRVSFIRENCDNFMELS